MYNPMYADIDTTYKPTKPLSGHRNKKYNKANPKKRKAEKLARKKTRRNKK